MREIRDRVIAELRAASFGEGQINYVLGMREIAIVDREAELPTMTDGEVDVALLSDSNKIKAVRVILNKLEERTVKAGWVKEVKYVQNTIPQTNQKDAQRSL